MSDSPFRFQSPSRSVGLSGKQTDIGISILLVVAAFLVFGQTLHHGFVNYDDDQYFYANPHVLGGPTWNSTAWAFQSGYASNWHLVTWLSLMLDAQLFGSGAMGPHLTNVILHAASAVLLFLLLRRMTDALWRSAIVAAVFVVHPLNVESVAWVSERKDVLSGFFFMLTLSAYSRYVEKVHTSKALMFYSLTLLFFAFGLMSKPMLVTLPFVLLLLDCWPLNRFKSFSISRLTLEKSPFFLLSAASCVVTVLAQREAVKSMETVPMADRIGNALASSITYIMQMVLPGHLSVFYPYRLNLPFWETFGAGTALLSVTLAAIWIARKFPYYLVGWFWYLGMLVPVIGLVQVGDQSHADRYVYLPMIGLSLVVVWGLRDLTISWRHQRQWLGASACGILAVLATYAWKQAAYWHDGETLWRHAIECTSGNYTAHNNLGYMLAAKGQTAEAVEQYHRALEICPGYAEADINLGRVFLEAGRLDEAGEYFRRAIELKPDSAEAHNDMGILLARQDEVAKAVQQYQKAIKLNPDLVEAYNNLAILLASQGQFAKAAGNYQKAIELKPDYADAQNNFGILLARQGKLAEAMMHFQKALEIRGYTAEAENDLGLLLVSADQPREATRHFEKAIELKSDYAEAHYYLGATLANQGLLAEAVKSFRKSLELANAQANSTLADTSKKAIEFCETNSTNLPNQ